MRLGLKNGLARIRSEVAALSKFAETHWSVVLNAANGDDPGAKRALAELCETYWYPLYGFARGLGIDEDEALDLTQGYFSHLLEKKLVDPVDPAKGRFRSYLRVTMRNYIHRQRRSQQAEKRTPGAPLLSLDAEQAEERMRLEPVDEVTPEVAYERRWASTLLATVLERERREYEARGKGDAHRVLAPYLLGEDEIPYSVAARELSMTEGAVRVAVHRMRRSLGEALCREIRRTVSDESVVEEELRHLITVVGSGGGLSSLLAD